MPTNIRPLHLVNVSLNVSLIDDLQMLEHQSSEQPTGKHHILKTNISGLDNHHTV